jgi:hypothetical protein
VKMALTYDNSEHERRDKAQLNLLHTVLNAAKAARRQDECGLWTIKGQRGYVSTWGDDKTWMIFVAGRSARHWTSIKKRLTACRAVITQDGDNEGVARLMKLPDAKRAAELRDIIGIRQTRDAPPNSFGPRAI